MSIATRLRSLERIAGRTRPPPGDADDCMREVRACPTTARMVVKLRAWVARGLHDDRTIRLMAVINARVARLRARGFPGSGP